MSCVIFVILSLIAKYSPNENYVCYSVLNYNNTMHKPEGLEFCLEGSDCGDEPDCCSLAASVGDLGVVFMECECR